MKPFDLSFTAGGKEYTMRYNFGARRAFEKRTGKSVPGLIQRVADAQNQTADDVIEIFLMLLSTDHPGITAEDVEKIIDGLGGEDEALTLLTKAISEETAPHPQ